MKIITELSQQQAKLYYCVNQTMFGCKDIYLLDTGYGVLEMSENPHCDISYKNLEDFKSEWENFDKHVKMVRVL